MRSAPDALVVTDGDGRILTANAAFLELAQLGGEEQARGESLDRWLGRTGVDLGVLLPNLRQRGAVRLFATLLRGEYGATTEVEISAVGRRRTAQPCSASRCATSAGAWPPSRAAPASCRARSAS